MRAGESEMDSFRMDCSYGGRIEWGFLSHRFAGFRLDHRIAVPDGAYGIAECVCPACPATHNRRRLSGKRIPSTSFSRLATVALASNVFPNTDPACVSNPASCSGGNYQLVSDAAERYQSADLQA